MSVNQTSYKNVHFDDDYEQFGLDMGSLDAVKA